MLGLATLWSPIFIVWLVVWFLRAHLLGLVSGSVEMDPEEALGALPVVAVMFVLTLATLVVLALTTLVYIAHILKNPALSERGKVAWSLANTVLGPFAMPLYWYLHVWRRRGD